MKSLNTIKKLHKYKMEELIKTLASIETELDETRNKLNKLIETEQKEIEEFSGSDFAFTLENFISQLKKEQEECDKNIKKLEGSIEKTRIMIHDEFSELKKIEHVIAIKKKKEKEKLEKTQSNQLDENTVLRHKRDFF